MIHKTGGSGNQASEQANKQSVPGEVRGGELGRLLLVLELPAVVAAVLHKLPAAIRCAQCEDEMR